MSMYTTGEIARLCGVSVRTVQYYDSRSILVPSELSEGGRRLYSEDDLKRMRIVCFLREAGMSIKNISDLLAEENPENIIFVLLDQQEQSLRNDLDEMQNKLDIITSIRREIKNIKNFSVESIGDIAHVMKKKTEMKRLRAIILFTGLPMNICQLVCLVLWIAKGLWAPFVVWSVIDVFYAIWLSKFYFRRVNYICPECHEVFKPNFKEAF